MNEQRSKFSTPVDGIMVLMDWYCLICRQKWKSFIDQGTIRRMPSYIYTKGHKVETRRPDGSMIRAHEECADRLIRHMEAKGIAVPDVDVATGKKKKRIIESAGENE